MASNKVEMQKTMWETNFVDISNTYFSYIMDFTIRFFLIKINQKQLIQLEVINYLLYK